MKVLFILYAFFLFLGTNYFVYCQPNTPHADWILEINKYALFLMVRDSEFPPGHAQSESVLKRLCAENDINFDFLDHSVISNLRHKIEYIVKPALTAIRLGGRQGSKLKNLKILCVKSSWED